VRRQLLAPIAVFTFLTSANADAQIIRSRFQLSQPAAWLTLGMGLQQGWTVIDGSTKTRWQFSNATQYVGGLEKALSGGANIGLRGSYSRVPLQDQSLVGGDVLVAEDADADVSQLFGTLRVATGSGFHSVLELSAGATMYSNFKARVDGRKLEPLASDIDFSFAFGYGFGYSFSREFTIDMVQDVTTTLHQKTGLSAGDESSVRTQGTRLVARFGLGGH
jgi:hypothetical protein